MRFHRLDSLVFGVAVLACLSPSVGAAQASRGEEGEKKEPEQRPSLGSASVTSLVELYGETDHWALKAILLLALGEDWHPDGGEMVLAALKDRDARVTAYAVEALRRTASETRAAVLKRPIVDNLINKQLKTRSDFYRARLLDVLEPILESVEDKSPRAVRRWWFNARKTYETPGWSPRYAAQPVGKESATRTLVAGAFVERAFEISQAGLDVVICIDTTGSMQPTIDAARDGVASLVTLLRSIAPRFRIGLVQYREVRDLPPGGAETLVPLTRDVRQVRAELADIKAQGGGDIPERVEAGLALSLSTKMEWALSTHKVVVVIGDAPPHSETIPMTLELARAAQARPFGREPESEPEPPSKKARRGRTRVSGKKKPVRPFTISCIAVAANRVNPDTAAAFKKIAAAGGGSYGEIAGTARGGDSYAAQVVEQVFSLSFGKGWEEEAAALGKIYVEYMRSEFFR